MHGSFLQPFCHAARVQDAVGVEAVFQALGQGGKGAGLGLIDIARKASEPIEYAFVPARNGQTYFSIKAVV